MSVRARKLEKLHIGRVLLAEDDELLGERLQKDLQRNDIECVWVKDFQSAEDALKKENIHCLVTDIYLSPSKPDGLDLISLANTYGVPSIIVTSALDLNIAKTGLNNGADHVIEKPVEVSQLLSTLEDIFENPKGLIARRERYLETHQLTEKEKELTRLILKGLTNKEISEVTGNSLATVKFYSSQIFEKFDVKNRAELFNLIFPT